MKIVKRFENIINRLTELANHPTYGILVYLLICFIGLVIILAILSTFGPISTKPLEIPTFGELLKKYYARPNITKLTLEDILCYVIWEGNYTNITVGNTTCIPWNHEECVCVTIIG